ncbi:YezD family protein [Novosphingobium album (ex Liu et al. 2023)]|uniref:YezD family protein n=1 Tax=Novosphingobium album (ex Liu et al. 2023) TaxID=3031130 RepID=A0ABT5WLC6_9SPHN|nr:YezD family protein [Novosphingobium album (ex Liu et al. 2023)]MDE8650112.1 YezD family protein [Novosphingobium album (ex Liu et al. 2023)]
MRSSDNPDNQISTGQDAGKDKSNPALSAVAEAVARLRYGAVHLTIHDGRVVQLDVTERQRFT